MLSSGNLDVLKSQTVLTEQRFFSAVFFPIDANRNVGHSEYRPKIPDGPWPFQFGTPGKNWCFSFPSDCLSNPLHSSWPVSCRLRIFYYVLYFWYIIKTVMFYIL